MRIITKITFERQSRIFVGLPFDAEFRLIDIEEGEITIWMEIDPNQELTRWEFQRITGEEIVPEGSKHVASVCDNHFIDYHVYKRIL